MTRADRWLLLALVAAAVGAASIRGRDLGVRSLWLEEAACWSRSRADPARLARAAVVEGDPTLYPLLLRAWTAAIGDSPALLRLPSLLLGVTLTIAAVGLVVEVGDPSRRRPEALAVGLMLSASAFVARYAQEAGPPMLAASLAAGGSWLLARALMPGARRPILIGYLAVRLAGLAAHPWSIAVALVDLGFCGILAARRGRAAGPASLAMAGLAIGLVPSATRWVGVCTSPAAASRKVLPVADIALAYPRLWWMSATPRGDAAFAIAALVATGAFVAWLIRHRGAWGGYLSAQVVAPLLIALLVHEVAGRTVFEDRALFVSYPYAIASAAILAASPVGAWARRLVIGALTLSSLAAWFVFAQGIRPDDSPGISAAAREIRGRRRPDEPILCTAEAVALPLAYYLRGEARPVQLRPTDRRQAVGPVEVEAVTGGGPFWAVSMSAWDAAPMVLGPENHPIESYGYGELLPTGLNGAMVRVKVRLTRYGGRGQGRPPALVEPPRS